MNKSWEEKKAMKKWEQEKERSAQGGATDGVTMKQGEKKRQGEDVDSLKGAQGAKGKLGNDRCVHHCAWGCWQTGAWASNSARKHEGATVLGKCLSLLGSVCRAPPEPPSGLVRVSKPTGLKVGGSHDIWDVHGRCESLNSLGGN